MTLIDPGFWRKYSRVVYGVLIAMLVLTPVLGSSVRNTRRWIDFGPFRFQPSEFGKLLLVLFLAAFLADRGKRIYERRTTLTAVGLAAVPMMLVFLQPDFGTAIVYAGILGATLFIAGTRWSQVSLLLAVGLAGATFVLWAGPAIGVDILKPYQRERITGFANPSRDPGGSTYNITQSITAVGAGGVDGRGPNGATQTNYNYLPEHATDFVFASTAEQRGFLGATILLLLYLLVIWRAIKVITLARDAFAAIAAAGIAFALAGADLHQRRDDDRDGADHGHSASVRERGRELDGREPARDRRPPVDLRSPPLGLHPFGEADDVALGVGEHRDRDLRELGHRQDRPAAELLGLVERRLRILGADVERHVAGPVGRLADPACDPAVLLLDQRVRHLALDLLRLPAEEVAVELLQLAEVLARDLEVDYRMCHCALPPSSSIPCSA